MPGVGKGTKTEKNYIQYAQVAENSGFFHFFFFFLMCPQICISTGFLTFFPLRCHLMTAKTSTFPSLYQAMHVHKQQHLPDQTVFVYHLDCLCDISGMHTTVWKSLVETTSCKTAEQPGLPQVLFISVVNFLAFGCRSTHLQLWRRYNLSYTLKNTFLVIKIV